MLAKPPVQVTSPKCYVKVGYGRVYGRNTLIHETMYTAYASRR